MKIEKNSRLSGFYQLTMAERRNELKKWTEQGNLNALINGGMSEELAGKMVENAIGKFSLPLGIATNFLINGKDLLIPMAVEEPSVIAAASNAAKMVRSDNGFAASADPSYTIAQIELLNATAKDIKAIENSISDIKNIANSTQPELLSLGGGIKEVKIRRNVGSADRVVIHLIVDCLDAMGANMVNTMAEAVAGLFTRITSGRIGLKILSNLADSRLATATCRINFKNLSRKGFSGEAVAKGVEAASDFAQADPYRAATHNKGIFNGIDPVLIATGNDWRAVSAGGHAYAAQSGQYKPLSFWHTEGDFLKGRIKMPMAVGIVGGAAAIHPAAVTCLKILNVKKAQDLAAIAVSTGLASNLAALAALSCEGIQAGHMKLHNRRLSHSG
jgi:hydroxymethylglutaryl-CoA reductase